MQNDPRERIVKENTKGTVGTPVSVSEDPDTDPDTVTDDRRDDTVTYSLGGPDGALFKISQATGQISVGSASLDFEATKNTYEVTS